MTKMNTHETCGTATGGCGGGSLIRRHGGVGAAAAGCGAGVAAGVAAGVGAGVGAAAAGAAGGAAGGADDAAFFCCSCSPLAPCQSS